MTDLPETTPSVGEVWVWAPDDDKFRSTLIVTRVTQHQVWTRRASGGGSFPNPLSRFVLVARREAYNG
jgi:hypothetical protein